MKLYMAVPTDYARSVIDVGFAGTRQMYENGADNRPDFTRPTADVMCEFRDMPPTALTFSRTAESTVHETDEGVEVTIDGGPVLADDLGDFVLCIDVPDDVASPWVITEEPGRILKKDDAGEWVDAGEAEPLSWPFREYWLPDTLANEYRDTLKVFDSDDGEEVRPDLVGK